MPFRMFCNSTDKKCRKEIEPEIDKKTNKVYCPECGLEVEVDQFMKRQLISLGQVRTEKKSNTAYSVKCKHCGQDKTPTLGKKREILCGNCGEDITDDLGGPFVQMLRTTLSRKQK